MKKINADPPDHEFIDRIANLKYLDEPEQKQLTINN